MKKENLPKVSIIVPTKDRPELLLRAIDSLRTQDADIIREIIIVNDGGREDHLSFYENNANSNMEFKVFKLEKSYGPSHARNIGLENATGDYICFLDDDDIYLPLTLDFRLTMIKKLEADVVYTRALRDIWKTLPDNKGYRSIGKQLYWDSYFDRDLILIQNISPNCCVLFSKESWNKSYWFDETMNTTEDHDFWVALSRNNDFEELKLVDCECSYRKDEKTQATGTLNFVPNWIKLFKKWRHTARNLEWVTEHQNSVLEKVGINPEEHGL